MSVFTFKKAWGPHKAGDAGTFSDPDEIAFVRKAISKDPDLATEVMADSAIPDIVKKSQEEWLAKAAPDMLKGMQSTFDAGFKGMMDNYKNVKPSQPAAWAEDDADWINPPTINKSANEVCYRNDPYQMVQKSTPRRSQNAFKGLRHFAMSIMGVGKEHWAAAARERDPDKTGLPDNVIDYLKIVRKSVEEGGVYADLKTKADPTGWGETLSSEAGLLVPPEFNMQIFERVYGNPLMQMTDTYPVGSNQITFLANAERSRVDGSRKGGVRGYWKGEAAQYTASKPKLRPIKLTPHKLTVLCWTSEELREDSVVSVDQYLAQNASDEINFKVGDALIRGTGAGMPLGWLNAPCTLSITKETGQAATTLVTENIDKMWARMYGPSRMNAVWFYNQDIEPQLAGMQRAVGTGGELVYSPPGGLAATPFAQLKGRPMIPIEFCSTLGTVGDLILVDMSQMLSCTRGTIKSAMSTHLRFDYDEDAFKFSFRMDAQPWWDAALTPYKGSNTQSPCITLETRS